MELTTVIENRRSIRNFKQKRIPKKDLTEILHCGTLSPSAKNRQPWEFIVINDKKLKNEIGDLLKQKSDPLTLKTCECIRECSTLILVFGTLEDPLMDTVSIGACIENMLLKATDLNIASLWIGYILKIEAELKTKFHKPNSLISAIALGYTNDSVPPRLRKSLESLTTWY